MKRLLLSSFLIYECTHEETQLNLPQNLNSEAGTPTMALSKFSMTWVASHMDLSEYDQLMGHAKNLGLDIAWLYQFRNATDDTSNDNISAFSQAAFTHYYINEVEQLLAIEWRCVFEGECDPEYPEGWYIYNIYPLNQFREVEY